MLSLEYDGSEKDVDEVWFMRPETNETALLIDIKPSGKHIRRLEFEALEFDGVSGLQRTAEACAAVDVKRLERQRSCGAIGMRF